MDKVELGKVVGLGLCGVGARVQIRAGHRRRQPVKAEL